MCIALTDGERVVLPVRVIPMILRAFSHPSYAYQKFIHPCLDTCPYSPAWGVVLVPRVLGSLLLRFVPAEEKLSLASSLHNFFLRLSLLCLSVNMGICAIGMGSLSWSVVFRSRGQFFFIMMSNGHVRLPPCARTTTIYISEATISCLLYRWHHLLRCVRMKVILKDCDQQHALGSGSFPTSGRDGDSSSHPGVIFGIQQDNTRNLYLI